MLTAGAFKQVVLALVPDFEKQTGNKVIVDNDTAGGLQKRIEIGRSLRRRDHHARHRRWPGRFRQNRPQQPRQSGDRRDRRCGEGRRAQAGHQHGRGLQERAACGQIGRLYRSGERRLERDLYRQTARAPRHRRPGPAKGKAQERRLCRRSHCQRRSRTWPAPDQRNRAGQRRCARRAVAEGNPEHHDLCGRLKRCTPRTRTRRRP